ncbi:MAG: ketoacyl-ACP synthase III [Clostridia bacterium]|nr:ketoacyl-ACP synthase III [Clostridia bacterium]
MSVKIVGTGSFLPAHIVTNEDLSNMMDTSDEWIKSRTGIETRHLAKDETTTGMAIEAAKKALANADLEAADLQLIIVATVSADHLLPCTSCEVQAGLGADQAVVFDINAACTGFLYALQIARGMLESNLYQNALIIGAETLSKIMDWNDRSTCVLFGDGAGAAILKNDPDDHGASGIRSCFLGADGKRGEALSCHNRSNNNILTHMEQKIDYVKMDGQAVYKFAVKTVPATILEALSEAETEIDEIKYFVLHQANMRIIESVAKRLGVSMEKFPVNLNRNGNISAASVPILLDEINQEGLLNPGDKIILAGFGGGLTFGASVVVW